MAVRKRGTIWHYDFMVRRVRYRGTIPEARNKAQAKQAEARARLDVFEGRYGKPGGTEGFTKFAREVYLPWAKENKRSWKSDSYHVEVLASYFGQKTFAEITPMLIERFKRDRKATLTNRSSARSAASVNRELACLSKIFSLAITHKVVGVNPCLEVKKYREENERTRYLLPEEEARLVAQCVGERAHLRPLLVLAINTGMRRGEILKLSWRHVDFERNLIRVSSDITKTGRPRELPMNSEVRNLLLEIRPAHSDGPVIPSPKTGKGIVDFKRAFRGACDKAQIEGLHFHDLRHTFGTRAADSGADAFTIAELLGHSDLRMTKRYTHATDQRKRAAVERLAEYGKAETNCLKFVTKQKREA
jgi:integrase